MTIPTLLEKNRLAIAAAIAAAHINRHWVFAPDNQVPQSAKAYAVYDGAHVLAGGLTISRVPELVAKARVPIVFYLPALRHFITAPGSRKT